MLQQQTARRGGERGAVHAPSLLSHPLDEKLQVDPQCGRLRTAPVTGASQLHIHDPGPPGVRDIGAFSERRARASLLENGRSEWVPSAGGHSHFLQRERRDPADSTAVASQLPRSSPVNPAPSPRGILKIKSIEPKLELHFASSGAAKSGFQTLSLATYHLSRRGSCIHARGIPFAIALSFSHFPSPGKRIPKSYPCKSPWPFGQ